MRSAFSIAKLSDFWLSLRSAVATYRSTAVSIAEQNKVFFIFDLWEDFPVNGGFEDLRCPLPQLWPTTPPCLSPRPPRRCSTLTVHQQSRLSLKLDWKLGPTLATVDTIVLKPAEQSMWRRQGRAIHQ
ncbi:uncharacterized protein [Drosophila pseudoobscura]|uniref:Uncharacterized protein n=1 Tax=Drosophila pseudoobscura pseudoobscura TaxID=46245 RepID=A0A6I8VPT6_DROPS|nr:uncharacterized protein LOC26533775 [Drosophila pseudoobscura]